MNVFEQIKKTYYCFSAAYKKIRTIDKAPIKIEEIDLATKSLIVRVQGARAIFKLALDELLVDPSIITILSPDQACWLGYYFVLINKKTDLMEINNLSNKNNFLLRNRTGDYKLISQDRLGNITYLNLRTNEIYTENPLEISQKKHLIKCFDSTQAFYIGLLSGINKLKNAKKSNVSSRQTVKLKLIK